MLFLSQKHQNLQFTGGRDEDDLDRLYRLRKMVTVKPDGSTDGVPDVQRRKFEVAHSVPAKSTRFAHHYSVAGAPFVNPKPCSCFLFFVGWHKCWWDFIPKLQETIRLNPGLASNKGRFCAMAHLQELNGLPLRIGLQLLTKVVQCEIDPKTMYMQAGELKRLYTVAAFSNLFSRQRWRSLR